jgi:hypothetical protein
MSRCPEDDNWKPNPEQLAAYVDGELDRCGAGAPLKRRIEDWLAGHPEAASTMEAHRQLYRVCKTTRGPQPREASWDDLWARINNAPHQTPAHRGRWMARRVVWAAALLLTAAAGVLLALTWAFRDRGRQGPLPEEMEPFPVASADEVEVLFIQGEDMPTLAVSHLFDNDLFPVASDEEVEILRINGADTGAPVVGELPVRGPLVLARAGEVQFLSVDRNGIESKVPEVRMEGVDSPMIWAPLDNATDK